MQRRILAALAVVSLQAAPAIARQAADTVRVGNRAVEFGFHTLAASLYGGGT